MGTQVSNPFTGDGDVSKWVKNSRVGQKPQTNKPKKTDVIIEMNNLFYTWIRFYDRAIIHLVLKWKKQDALIRIL